jgi:hypothetical protein
MQVYTIGYKSTDGTKALEITHDRQLSSAELEALVCDVLPDAARRHIAALAEKERKRGQIPEAIFETCFIPHVTFNHLYKHVADLLVERHGFQHLIYTATLTVFAVPDLLVRGDAAGDPDGDDALQERLSDAMEKAGLPVVTMDGREVQEEAKIQALTPIRRERRAQRAVARFKATGHNPFLSEDVALVSVILSQLAERPLAEAETTAMEELLPPLLEQRLSPEQLGQAFLDKPELVDLAAVLGVHPVVEEPVEEEPGDDEPQNEETAPEEDIPQEAVSEELTSEEGQPEEAAAPIP